MASKGIDLDTVHFGEFAKVLREADDVGILLRGHLWIEALLEYAVRGKLKRPDAIDWANSRFGHKVALAEAVGAIDPDLAAAIRGFNRLRNRIAHEFTFEVAEGEVMTFVGRLSEEHQRRIDSTVHDQLEILREIELAEAKGYEVEIDPGLDWYFRVMTPTRARLFAFVIWTARELAFEGAFGAMDRNGVSEPLEFMNLLDSEVARLTGGIFRFRPTGE